MTLQSHISSCEHWGRCCGILGPNESVSLTDARYPFSFCLCFICVYSLSVQKPPLLLPGLPPSSQASFFTVYVLYVDQYIHTQLCSLYPPPPQFILIWMLHKSTKNAQQPEKRIFAWWLAVWWKDVISPCMCLCLCSLWPTAAVCHRLWWRGASQD